MLFSFKAIQNTKRSKVSKVVQNPCKIRATKQRPNMAKVTIYHDTRAAKKDNPAPVKLVIRHQNQTAMISTGILVPKQQWDKQANKVTYHINRRKFNDILTNLYHKASNIVFELRMSGKLNTLTVFQIRDIITKELWNESKKTEKTVGEICDIIIQQSIKENTKKSYKSSFKTFITFDNKFRERQVKEINADWLRRYIIYATEQLKNSKNTLSLRIVNLIHIVNLAQDSGIEISPNVKKVKVKKQTTKKRSLTLQEMRQVWNYKPATPAEQAALDLFKLSFLLIGINTTDIMNLAPPINGRAEYYRAKTGRLYNIKVEPEAQQIIDRYKTETKAFQPKRKISSILCQLSEIDFKIPHRISMYWARHTWATFAAELDISTDTIAAALGHGQNGVTDIYINRNQKKVDNANRAVIDYLLKS